MIIREVGEKQLLAAREEGMEYANMDTFAYTGTITEAINNLKKDGYKIFYLNGDTIRNRYSLKIRRRKVIVHRPLKLVAG